MMSTENQRVLFKESKGVSPSIESKLLLYQELSVKRIQLRIHQAVPHKTQLPMSGVELGRLSDSKAHERLRSTPSRQPAILRLGLKGSDHEGPVGSDHEGPVGGQ